MRLATLVCATAVLLAGDVAADPGRAGMRIAPCANADYTAAIGGAPVQPSAPGTKRPSQLTLVLAGDTGFNPKGAPVDPHGFTKNRQSLTYAESLSGIAGDVDGDLAFLNLETVVTDRNDLPPDLKGQTAPYNFRSHPAGLKSLVGAGFNLFSLANNHSMDFGTTGAEETLYHLAMAGAARAKGEAIAYAGLGADFEEATRPGCLGLGDMKLGFAATGIVTGQRAEHRAGEGKPGQAAYRRREDFEIVVNRLREQPADYRILSVHYGLEGRVVPDKRQRDDWREFAAREKGIDLIVGHHPHVAQGVERVGDSFVFYGLGNFLHPGTAEMKRFGLCRDYGLMAKVHLARSGEEWTVGAIEAIPITNTHVRPERFSPQDGTRRIFALNYLGAKLGNTAGTEGIAFTPRGDGTGLYCAAGAVSLGGKIGALCAAWTPAPAVPVSLASRLQTACADKPFYGAGRKKKRRNSNFGFRQF
ncbi:MAG TPA: hypothetical protein DDW48_00315 [Methyloceanibacter sp.]|nr:hypothetical protein [Methyloceanibacter sp.]